MKKNKNTNLKTAFSISNLETNDLGEKRINSNIDKANENENNDTKKEKTKNNKIKYFLDDYEPEIKAAKNLFAKYKSDCTGSLKKDEKEYYSKAYDILNEIIIILSEDSDRSDYGSKPPIFHYGKDNETLKKILRTNWSIKNKVIVLKMFKNDIPNQSQFFDNHSNSQDRYKKILRMPFDKYRDVNYNGAKIRKCLDDSHFGMETIKEELCSYFESLKYKRKDNRRAKVICFVGSPGTGKTTIALSLAKAIGVDTYKIGIGSISAAFVLNGSHETWKNAQEGEIARILLTAEYMNPLIILDEIDKAANIDNGRGNVVNTLLSLLDPDNNSSFYDEYLGIPIDISNVLFICTANDEQKIPAVLRDRLEIIHVPTYSKNDKIQIAKKYMIPRIKKSYIDNLDNINISDDALEKIVLEMTLETQNRGMYAILERVFEKAVCVSKSSPFYFSKEFIITTAHLKKWIKKEEKDYIDINNADFCQTGVVNGLGIYQGLGNILKIEVAYCKGSGNTIITGFIREVMQEATKVAIGMLKTNSSKFAIPENFFSKHDIYINFTDTSQIKDGTSAGVATALAMLSAIKNVIISNDICITGEITLRGFIGPVGGVIEKAIGAYQNGAKYIFIPKSNYKDAEKIREYINKEDENIKVIEINSFNELVEKLCEIDEKYYKLKN